MKHYLLTWYGITDLRAALGFEAFGGPVLGALKAGPYTDALILAYTNPDKRCPDAVDRAMHWLEQQSLPGATGAPAPSRAQQDEVVDAFSNTAAGHDLYETWLRGEVDRLGLAVEITMCGQELASLNDAKGIYEAASRALDIVLSRPEERLVTLYLSPGTPLMAFTWAFLALTNPDLDIKVIVCPDYRKPPEEIQVPYELLTPPNRRARPTIAAGEGHFDVVFHLFGEQRLPSILGARQFPCPRHFFITSEAYPSGIMRKFIPAGAEYGQICVNPFDPMSVNLAVLKAVAGLPPGSRIGFNLTGGTKLMFAGALSACRKAGGVPFYFETRDHNLLFLHDFTTMPARGIDSVDTFLQANGFVTTRPGRWADSASRQQRVPLTNILWKQRSMIAQSYRALLAYNNFEGDAFTPFSLQAQQGRLEMSLDKAGRAHLRLDRDEFTFEWCPDFAKYLSGGWLEEYTYLLLEPLLRRGEIRDLRIGLEVSWDAPSAGGRPFLAQEFDVVLTNGKRLVIIECKAGNVLNEQVHKLQNCVRNYGGVEARGLLVSAFPTRPPVTRRLESASNLSALHGRDVPNSMIRVLLGLF